MTENVYQTKARPFLRWAGGKTWLVKHIPKFLPENFNNYHEPFVGGGSVFFYLKSANLLKGRSVLSDSNPGLINAYRIVRDAPHELIQALKRYENSEKVYYAERQRRYDDPIKEASRFIFLNRTSFNGIYRENLKGEYNVPYGYKKYKVLFDFDNLLNASRLLQNVDLQVSDFSKSMEKAAENDLVFIDPPYTVAHENNGFVKYNQKIFSWEDQIDLKNSVQVLQSKRVYFILTNAYHASIKALYKGIGVADRLDRFSVIGGLSAKREKYHEIIIFNAKD